MGYLVGLEGMPKRVVANYAASPSQAMKVLATRRNVTNAGDAGAITVWRPRGGGYRARFDRRFRTLSDETFTTKKALRAWLARWWPAMDDYRLPND